MAIGDGRRVAKTSQNVTAVGSFGPPVIVMPAGLSYIIGGKRGGSVRSC